MGFQQLMLDRAHPEWQVGPFLMLVDPSVPVAADGLGAGIAVRSEGWQTNVEVDPYELLDPPFGAEAVDLAMAQGDEDEAFVADGGTALGLFAPIRARMAPTRGLSESGPRFDMGSMLRDAATSRRIRRAKRGE